ncbi:MAG: hypothetical protein U9R43_06115 [Thermodesulfobacteriota bacterium]|nr:hypothetical protein [Thermodesulfobacteriota bacterium]
MNIGLNDQIYNQLIQQQIQAAARAGQWAWGTFPVIQGLMLRDMALRILA